MEAVLGANLSKILVVERSGWYVELRLEKRSTASAAPSYRFVVVGRQCRKAR
jgi:hypothetical protein